MLVAGHETTSHTLSWAVERLRRHPELLQRLVDGGRRGRQGAARGDDPRGAAHAPRDRVRRARRAQAVRARRLPAAGRHAHPARRLPDALRPGAVPRIPSASTPTASSTSSPTPTRGSRSAAASAAASARPSRTWRWTSCCACCSNASSSCATDAPGERWAVRGIVWAPGDGGRAVVRARVRSGREQLLAA